MRCTFAVAFALIVLGGAGAAAAQAPENRPPTAVAASFPITWAAVERVVKSEPGNGRLDVLSDATGRRRGRWRMMIPSSDFRAAEWATCQSGTESAVAPRQGVFDVAVAGDTAPSTVVVTAQWSAEDPEQEQRAIECRTSGRLERELEKNIRSRAEKEARKN